MAEWCATTAARAPAASATSRTASTSAGVSVGNELIATTTGTSKSLTFSICLARFARAGRHRLDVLLEQRRVERLARHDLADAAVHLERADRGHHDGRVGAEAGRPALDVEELLGAHVRTESRLRADDVVRRERHPVGEDRVVAVGDVRERPAVHEGGAALEGLEQVRLDRVASSTVIAPADVQVVGRDRRPVARRRQHDPAEPGAQVRRGRWRAPGRP